MSSASCVLFARLVDKRASSSTNGIGKGGHIMLKVRYATVAYEWAVINDTTGIWVSPTPTEPPVLTLFGSTNLNSRSAHIDTELSFIMVIPSDGGDDKTTVGGINHITSKANSTEPATTPAAPEQPDALMALRRRLAEEVRDLRAHTGPWQGDKRHVRIGTKAIVGFVGGML